MSLKELFLSAAVFILFIVWGYEGIKYGSRNNNIEQVGHTKATAHIICYSGSQVIYQAFVKDFSHGSSGDYSFIQDSTGKHVRVNGNCVVEQ